MTDSFNSLNVVSFESRRAKEIEKLIRYHGGNPIVAPSMREVPLSESTEALGFAERLIAGAVDVVVLLTGVGTRAMVEAISTKYPREQFISALGKSTIVARGPKPITALKEMSLTPDVVIPEPNTWRDILSVLDAELSIDGKTVAVQEYGVSNPDLIEGLEKMGADVMAVPVYRWELPEDLEPLRGAIRTIACGGADIALFTTAQQIRHLLQVANHNGMEEELRKGFMRTVIGSIGPTTTEALNDLELRADYEPNSPRMGNLVREMARSGAALLRKKRIAQENGVDTNRWSRAEMVWVRDGADIGRQTRGNSVFLKACRGEATEYTPIWIMRQAGRFLREYRELRRKVSFIELCKTPELAAEVTLMAVDRLGVDAAIIFADILLILQPLGVGIEFSKGEGPVIDTPVRGLLSVEGLSDFDPAALEFVYEAVKTTRRALDPDIALIGFAGAPFTVASYAIEGGGSRSYINTKAMMYSEPEAWHQFMEKLSYATASYLNRQIEAGADAVQLFDSWVGCLSPEDYKQFVMPHTKGLIDGIKSGVPVIHFGTGTATLLTHFKEAGGDVIGFDWRVNLDEAWEQVGYDVAVQGNLDPVALFAPKPEMERRAKRVIDLAGGRPGHIFNLGHGVLPKTPVDNVLALVDVVHEYSAEVLAGDKR
ncbi:MAG: uroporphyrinogen decarboxylase [Thermodesulfobacteriota bacterium]